MERRFLTKKTKITISENKSVPGLNTAIDNRSKSGLNSKIKKPKQ